MDVLGMPAGPPLTPIPDDNLSLSPPPPAAPPLPGQESQEMLGWGIAEVVRPHAVHTQCTRSAHAVHTQCTCSVPAVHTQCTCGVIAVYMQCTCSVYAVYMQCTCSAARRVSTIRTTSHQSRAAAPSGPAPWASRCAPPPRCARSSCASAPQHAQRTLAAAAHAAYPAAPEAHPLAQGCLGPRGSPLLLGCRREAALLPAQRHRFHRP